MVISEFQIFIRKGPKHHTLVVFFNPFYDLEFQPFLGMSEPTHGSNLFFTRPRNGVQMSAESQESDGRTVARVAWCMGDPSRWVWKIEANVLLFLLGVSVMLGVQCQEDHKAA